MAQRSESVPSTSAPSFRYEPSPQYHPTQAWHTGEMTELKRDARLGTQVRFRSCKWWSRQVTGTDTIGGSVPGCDCALATHWQMMEASINTACRMDQNSRAL